jgi:hypothetical protein
MQEERKRFRIVTRLGAAFSTNVAAGFLFAIFVSSNPLTLTTNAALCILYLYTAYILEQLSEYE